MKKYLLIFLMLCGTSAFAETHKWIDSHGKVQYSDLPPADIETTTLRSAPAPGSAPAATKTLAEREAELKKAQQAKKEAEDLAAKKQADAQAEKSNCAAARQTLLSLQSGIRISEYDASGERRYIDDNERQQRTAQAQQEVAKWCK